MDVDGVVENRAIAASIHKFVTLLREFGTKLLLDRLLQLLQLRFEKSWYESNMTLTQANPYRIPIDADDIGQTSITMKDVVGV
jgi:hypothetical protein